MSDEITSLPLSSEIQRLAAIAQEAGTELRKAQWRVHQGQETISSVSKGNNSGTDFVTKYDIATQHAITEAEQAAPELNGYGIIGEEKTGQVIERKITVDEAVNKHYQELIVDPIDGTGNFRDYKEHQRDFAIAIGITSTDEAQTVSKITGGIIHLPMRMLRGIGEILTGAEEAIAQEEGATFAVDLQRKHPEFIPLNDAAQKWEADVVQNAALLVDAASREGKELCFLYHEIKHHKLDEHMDPQHLAAFSSIIEPHANDAENQRWIERQTHASVVSELESAVLRKHGFKVVTALPVFWAWDAVAGTAMNHAIPGNKTVFLTPDREPGQETSFIHHGSNIGVVLERRNSIESHHDNQVSMIMGSEALVDQLVDRLDISRHTQAALYENRSPMAGRDTFTPAL